ncbi:methyltransferase domain-containing protein [bacterium]|nr:methyltransferase domain-containing protein [bacterium]
MSTTQSVLQRELTTHYEKLYQDTLSDSPRKSRFSLANTLLCELDRRGTGSIIINLGAGRQQLELDMIHMINAAPVNERNHLKRLFNSSKYFTTDVATLNPRKLPWQIRSRENVRHIRNAHQSLAFATESVDIAISNLSLDFALDKMVALREVNRVLKERGCLLVNLHHPRLIKHFIQTRSKVLEHPFIQYVMGNKHFYNNEEEINGCFRAAGFCDVYITLETDGLDNWWQVKAIK